MPIVAVLTGDLIGSTAAGLQAVDTAMAELAAAAAEISIWRRGADTRFTRHRGDGWQLILADRPFLCLRAALFLVARLRARGAPSTRIAIGIGQTRHVSPDRLSDASGEAFERSGRALEHMGRSQWLAIAGRGVTVGDTVIARLLDERVRRWSPHQAEAIALFLDPGNPTLADLSARLGISPQAVSYRLNGAGAAAIRKALQDWEQDFEIQRLPALTEQCR